MNETTKNSIKTIATVSAGLLTLKYGRKGMVKAKNRLINKVLPYKPEDISGVTKSAMEKMLHDTGFDKEIEIINLTEKNFDTYNHTMIENFKFDFNGLINHEKNIFKKNIYKIKKHFWIKKMTTMNSLVAKGKNAYYHNNNKQIVINMDKRPELFAHELAHAHAAITNNKTSAIIHKLRNFKIETLSMKPVVIISALTGNNPQNSDKSKFKKTMHNFGEFIKNNCAQIAIIGFTPTLIDEMKANIIGQKFAKKYVTKENLKRFTRAHLYSCASYLGRTIIAGLSVYLAVKAADFVKNKINLTNRNYEK